MRGYIITDTSMGGCMVSDWADNGDGTETPDLGTAKDKAREILDARISFLQSRLDNLDSIDDDDEDAAEQYLVEACDDLSFSMEPVEILGEGPEATMAFLDLDARHTLQFLSEDAGRSLPVRWPPLDIPA
jgi:hypothetical protein